MLDWLFSKSSEEEVKKEPIGGIIKRVGGSVETDSYYLSYNSSLLISEAGKLIGKTIEYVIAEKESITFVFENGDKFTVSGFTLDEEGKADSLDTKYYDKLINL